MQFTFQQITDNGKLYAFDENGNLLWNKVMGERAAMPAYSNGNIFVGTDGGLYSLNENGDVEWNFDADVSSQPIINDDSVIVGTEDGLYCISQENGKFGYYWN